MSSESSERTSECPRGGLHDYQDVGRIRVKLKTKVILKVTIKCMKCGDTYVQIEDE